MIHNRLGLVNVMLLQFQLHTMAAYYPETPSEEHKDAMRAFLTGLALFYPCSHCAEAFQQDIIDLPPE